MALFDDGLLWSAYVRPVKTVREFLSLGSFLLLFS